MYIFGITCDRESKKEIRDYLRDHWTEWSSEMKSYKAFSYRLNLLENAFIDLNEYIAAKLDNEFGEGFRKLMDTMPIAIAKAKRSN